jgi:hypothetical protein
MILAGFEPTTPVFERSKTVHALNCKVTVMGLNAIFVTPIPDSDIFEDPKILVHM